MLATACKPIANEKRLELIKILFGDVSGETRIKIDDDGVDLSFAEDGKITALHLTKETEVTENIILKIDNQLLSHAASLAGKISHWRSETINTVIIP